MCLMVLLFLKKIPHIYITKINLFENFKSELGILNNQIGHKSPNKHLHMKRIICTHMNYYKLISKCRSNIYCRWFIKELEILQP